MKERDIDTEIKEVWKQLSDERKSVFCIFVPFCKKLLNKTKNNCKRPSPCGWRPLLVALSLTLNYIFTYRPRSQAFDQCLSGNFGVNNIELSV